MYVIEAMNGPLDGKRWPFERDITIGRDERVAQAALTTDRAVSRRHAAVRVENGALVLVDVSRQGGDPGTLYVMEVDPDSIEGGIDDGAQIDPHGMDPETVLRFVKATGGWPGRVVVIACEPEQVEEVALGLSPSVAAAVDGAVDLVAETVEELRCTSSR